MRYRERGSDRYQLRATIVGFNLPFDISRIAISDATARTPIDGMASAMHGGFTFKLSNQKIYPNVRIKHLSQRTALIAFAATMEQRTARGQRKRGLTPTVDAVDMLADENQRLAFVRAFRELARLKNVLAVFAEFDWAHLDLDNQTFDEFKSKYLDIHDLTRKESEEGTVSIVNDVDFELELIRQDKINVAYILQLLRDLKDDDKRADKADPVDHEKRLADILDIVASEAQLRSKRELIEKFIQQNMAQLAPGDDVTAVFKAYWDQEKEAAFAAFCAQEGLDRERFDKLVDQFNFNGQPPLRDDVVATLIERPKILERRKIVDRVIEKMRTMIRTFDDAIGDV